MIPLLWACCACSQTGRIVGAAPTDLAQPEGVEVLFNHRDGRRYRSPLTGKWRKGDDLEQILVDAIDAAESEILVAIQQLTLPRIAQSLIAAQQRGLKVHVVLENTYSTPWSRQLAVHLPKHQRRQWQQFNQLADRNQDGVTTPEEAADADAVALLLNAGIPLIDDTEDGSRGSGLMHHKFVVIDGMQVITGSANATSSGLHGDAGASNSRGNVNHLLSIRSRELADLFREEFQRMWGDGPGGKQDSLFGLTKESGGVKTVMVGKTRIDVLFAPHRKREPVHSLTWLGEQLASAERSIDMALFVFSAQQLTSVLQGRVEAGVDVRLVADPGFASRPFSEVLDLLGVSLPDRNCKIERDNQPFEQALKGVGTPRLARGDKLHHKFAVIDNKKVITGSFNWSPAAAHINDETLLVIHSPKLAKHFSREMDRLWDTAELGITPHIQSKLDRQRIKCGDGVSGAK